MLRTLGFTPRELTATLLAQTGLLGPPPVLAAIPIGTRARAAARSRDQPPIVRLDAWTSSLRPVRRQRASRSRSARRCLPESIPRCAATAAASRAHCEKNDARRGRLARSLLRRGLSAASAPTSGRPSKRLHLRPACGISVAEPRTGFARVTRAARASLSRAITGATTSSKANGGTSRATSTARTVGTSDSSSRSSGSRWRRRRAGPRDVGMGDEPGVDGALRAHGCSRRDRFLSAERFARGALGLAGATAPTVSCLGARTGPSPAIADARSCRARVAREDERFAMSLALEAVAPVAVHGDRGFDVERTRAGQRVVLLLVPDG